MHTFCALMSDQHFSTLMCDPHHDGYPEISLSVGRQCMHQEIDGYYVARHVKFYTIHLRM